MNYSRANSSPRYRELKPLYRTMHGRGKAFLGIPLERDKSLAQHRTASVLAPAPYSTKEAARAGNDRQAIRDAAGGTRGALLEKRISVREGSR
jgi:hypothetical protein